MSQNRRWINTRVELEWDKALERYVEVFREGYWYDGPMALAHASPSLDQDSYAFYNDGTESGSTIIGTANNPQTLDADTTYQVRFLIQEANGGSSNSNQFQLQYNLNGGGWNNVTGTSNVVRSTAGALTEDGNTTQRLGSGTFISSNGGQDEVDGLTLSNGISFVGNDESEVLYSF